MSVPQPPCPGIHAGVEKVAGASRKLLRAAGVALGAALSALAAASCADVLGIRTSRYLVDAGGCQGTLRVKVLYDMSGSTSDVGVPAGKGVVDHLRAINAAGGIRGCMVDFEEADTRYDVESTLATYRGWAAAPGWADVSTVFGQGTPMSEALGPLAAQDGKLLVTTAYNGELATPTKVEQDISVPSLNGSFSQADLPVRKQSPGYPFVFFQGTDYTTAARIGVQFAWNRGAKRVGFFACTTSAFCTDPLDGAKTFLAVLGGTQVGRDLAIELDDDDGTIEGKVEAYFRAELDHAGADSSYAPVDWIWFGNTRTTLARLANALARIRTRVPVSPTVVSNNWGLDEQLFAACGDACVGTFGVQPMPVFGDGSASGMATLLDVHRAARDAAGEPADKYGTVQYVYGYVAVAAWRAAVESAIDAGRGVTGSELRAAFESSFDQRAIDGFVTLSYSSTDHRPQPSARIYTLAPGGNLAAVGQPISIALRPEWLGW